MQASAKGNRVMAEHDLAVIVICNNTGIIIRETHNELCIVLASLGLNIELIYVDNGSRDDTVYRLRNLEITAKNIGEVIPADSKGNPVSLARKGWEHFTA